MALETPPFAIQYTSLTYSAEQTRRAMFFWAGGASSTATGTGGIRSANDLLVQAPVSGLSVLVGGYSTSNHDEILLPGQSTIAQGMYYGRMTSQTSVTVSSNSSGNPRIDLVYAQVQDSNYTGATQQWVVAIATGTATSGATLSNLNGAPSLPTSAIALGYVLVPNGASSIVSGDILNVATGVIGPGGGKTTYASDSGWLNFAYLNSWSGNTGGGNPTPGYRLQGNVVRLKGSIIGGATNTVAIQLPVGFRPPADYYYPSQNAVATTFSDAYVTIDSSGVIVPNFTGTLQSIMLDGITWTVD